MTTKTVESGYSNKRAAVGQAINLAVADALHHGQENNPKYIYTKVLYYSQIADAVQNSDADMLKEVINNTELNELLSRLDKALKP